MYSDLYHMTRSCYAVSMLDLMAFPRNPVINVTATAEEAWSTPDAFAVVDVQATEDGYSTRYAALAAV